MLVGRMGGSNISESKNGNLEMDIDLRIVGLIMVPKVLE
jgi:hypothetical protein